MVFHIFLCQLDYNISTNKHALLFNLPPYTTDKKMLKSQELWCCLCWKANTISFRLGRKFDFHLVFSLFLPVIWTKIKKKCLKSLNQLSACCTIFCRQLKIRFLFIVIFFIISIKFQFFHFGVKLWFFWITQPQCLFNVNAIYVNFCA